MASIFRYLPELPNATAELVGTSKYPDIRGTVEFFQFKQGVLVYTEVFGLPSDSGNCNGSIYYMQIYEKINNGSLETTTCLQADSDLPYNPYNCAPPNHAGYLPPIIESFGYAHISIFTGRFTVQNIISRTVAIHAPAKGDALLFQGILGEKIACGIIQRS